MQCRYHYAVVVVNVVNVAHTQYVVNTVVGVVVVVDDDDDDDVVVVVVVVVVVS